MAYVMKNPPEFTLEVEQWNRDTLADGVEMSMVPEALLNNDVFLKERIERQEHTELVTLLAAGWAGAAAPFVQSVNVPGAAEGMEPMVVSALSDGADAAEQKAYGKAFGMICGGTAELGNGTATFRVYKRPATDITVGLRGV